MELTKLGKKILIVCFNITLRNYIESEIKNALGIKELPNNIEAEQSVIGSVLVSNEIFDEINMMVASKNFYDPMHQKIFSAIEKLIYSGMLANPITLKNHFEFDLNHSTEMFVKSFIN